MKNSVFIIILLSIGYLSISCSETNITENEFQNYYGTWLWFKTQGGFGGTISVPEEGIVIKISFDNQNTFKVFRNDSLKVIASYNIEKAEYDQDKISYSNITTYNYYFNSKSDYSKIQTDTLNIWDGMIDGFSSFYRKIK